MEGGHYFGVVEVFLVAEILKVATVVHFAHVPEREVRDSLNWRERIDRLHCTEIDEAVPCESAKLITATSANNSRGSHSLS
jgi:hypothetical protein